MTARKRAESVQTVPTAVTAISPELIEQRNIGKLEQLGAIVPGATLKQAPSIPTEVQPFIRSIGDRSSEPSQDLSNAISIDGVYLATAAGSNVDIFDVEQVEVLRGPQGVLQGRNSVGGALNIKTRRPSGEFGARALASYERFGLLQLKAFVEAPVVEDLLAVKLSAFRTKGGNYLRNITTGKRDVGGQSVYGGRLGILLTPGDDFTAYLTAEYTRDSSPPPAIRARNHADTLPAPYEGALPEGPPAVCATFGECSTYPVGKDGFGFFGPNRSKVRAITLNADWDLGPATLTSITGYRATDQILTIDLDATPSTVYNLAPRKVRARAFSQEVRLTSDDSNRFKWLVGGYYLRSRIDVQQSSEIGGPLFGLPSTVLLTNTEFRSPDTDSYALFGQASLDITDKWDVSLGGRKTWDRKRLVSTPSPTSGTGRFSRQFSEFTTELSTRYRFNRDLMAYFRFAQGYRGGGFNGSATSIAAINSFEPETIDSYELGLKTSLFDRAVTFNLTAFHYDYKDVQLIAIDAVPGLGYVNRVINARGLGADGVEAEFVIRASDRFKLSGNLAYLDTDYRPQVINFGTGDVLLQNVRRQNAPRWSGLIQADYNIPLGDGELALMSSFNYRSSAQVNDVPSAVSFQKAYGLIDAEISYSGPDKRYSIALFGQNLTNKYYMTYGEPVGGLFYFSIDGRPRTFGVRVTGSF
ncbi:TonB-dependent receptor [Sphingobium phenoxybenzoativorans]|uniref:TonB-dependent receptor n=1 Tax=Sphingobium phenoxybenzoativorans TaxID=1592790 RepID=UPI001495F72C|nr:TonB-dependent receptor [Sphingobium phenoxybenzoativorans]